MARISEQSPAPSRKIFMYEKTVKSLDHNTIIYDYFQIAKKIMDEGYELIFIGINETVVTPIKDIEHLKNYFKVFSSIKDF